MLGGAIWLNPFATVLFTVCSAVTVECYEVHSPLNSFGYWTLNKYYYLLLLCFVNVLLGCVWFVCGYVRKKDFLQCLQLLRGGLWACMRCPCLCLSCVLGWGLC